MLVLESYAHAQSRNARIYAELLDYQSCSDAANIVQIEKSGQQIIRMLGAISDGHKIDYLNAHGTGTETNDEVEALAIQKVFGDAGQQPLINSTKGILGHTVGASGAIAGVTGAYFVFYPRARILTLVPIFLFWDFVQVPAVVFLFLWFAMQVVYGMMALGWTLLASGGTASAVGPSKGTRAVAYATPTVCSEIPWVTRRHCLRPGHRLFYCCFHFSCMRFR